MNTAPDDVEQWIRWARSSNPVVRERALQHLVGVRDDRVTPVLLAAFRAGSRRHRVSQALAESGDRTLVEPMLEVLDGPDRDLRAAACHVLGRLGDRRATPALCRCLSDPWWEVRRQAAWALATLRDPAALPHLVARRDLGQQEDYNVQAGITAALGALGQRPEPARRLADPEAASVLLAAATSDAAKDVRVKALGELALLRAPQAAEALRALLDDADGDVRAGALKALGELKQPQDLGPIAARLADAEWRVRSGAARALEAFDDPSVAQALRPLLSDPARRVRDAVKQSLGRIDHRRREASSRTNTPAADSSG